MRSRLNYFYDTEFIDTGSLIKFISIGMVCEDGRYYYAVNSEMDAIEVRDDPWHSQNTWPHLPHPEGRPDLLDYQHPSVKPRAVIRSELQLMLSAGGRRPALWAWYDAHDFLVFTQLFGPLHSLPAGIPPNGYDLKQEFDLHRTARMVSRPPEPENAHHALADAYWNLELGYRLGIVERPQQALEPVEWSR